MMQTIIIEERDLGELTKIESIECDIRGMIKGGLSNDEINIELENDYGVEYRLDQRKYNI